MINSHLMNETTSYFVSCSCFHFIEISYKIDWFHLLNAELFQFLWIYDASLFEYRHFRNTIRAWDHWAINMEVRHHLLNPDYQAPIEQFVLPCVFDSTDVLPEQTHYLPFRALFTRSGWSVNWQREMGRGWLDSMFGMMTNGSTGRWEAWVPYCPLLFLIPTSKIQTGKTSHVWNGRKKTTPEFLIVTLNFFILTACSLSIKCHSFCIFFRCYLAWF